jgi:aldehyde:ferredoxin oxidoreductase
MDNGLSGLGLHEPVGTLDLGPKKVRAFYYTQSLYNLYNSIGMCDFVGVPSTLRLDKLCAYVNAATGWDMTPWEMLKVGERANTMYRLFNNRAGLTSADDMLPQRMFEPLENGALKGVAIDPQEFVAARQLYYQMAGWGDDGVPTLAKLVELELEWTLEPVAA